MMIPLFRTIFILYHAGREHFNKTLRILNGYMSWLKRMAKAKGQAIEPT